jgi:hypothetical protein
MERGIIEEVGDDTTPLDLATAIEGIYLNLGITFDKLDLRTLDDIVVITQTPILR